MVAHQYRRFWRLGCACALLALALQVFAAPRAQPDRDPIALEVELDRDWAYVQQQVLLTVRLRHHGPLQRLHLDDPQPEHMLVRRLRHAAFLQDSSGSLQDSSGSPQDSSSGLQDGSGSAGSRRQVYEWTYALFPQRTGRLAIPAITVGAVDGTQRRRFLDPVQGRLLQRRSEPLALEVRGIPAHYPDDAPWLPASSLQLTQSWSHDPGRVQAGQTLARELGISADGLLAAQLPPLPALLDDSLRHYPDPPRLDDAERTAGVRGQRLQRDVLVPGAAGRFTLPARRVPWWNTATDSLEYAELPQTVLRVAAASTPAPRGSQAFDNGTGYAASPWRGLSLLLGGGWLATLALWAWREGWRPWPRAAASRPAQPDREAAAHRRLRRHLRRHDARASRDALLHWARLHYGAGIGSLADLLQRVPQTELRDAVDDMERALWGPGTASGPGRGGWRGDRLLVVVERLRRNAPEPGPERAPLYR